MKILAAVTLASLLAGTLSASPPHPVAAPAPVRLSVAAHVDPAALAAKPLAVPVVFAGSIGIPNVIAWNCTNGTCGVTWGPLGSITATQPYLSSSSGSLLHQANVANSGSNVAHIFDTGTTLSGSTLLASFRNNTGEKVKIDNAGSMTLDSWTTTGAVVSTIGANGNLRLASGSLISAINNNWQITPISSTNGWLIQSGGSDGASAIALKIAANADLTTAGAKIASFGDNAGSSYAEKFAIDLNGDFVIPEASTLSVSDGTHNVFDFADSSGQEFFQVNRPDGSGGIGFLTTPSVLRLRSADGPGWSWDDGTNVLFTLADNGSTATLTVEAGATDFSFNGSTLATVLPGTASIANTLTLSNASGLLLFSGATTNTLTFSATSLEVKDAGGNAMATLTDYGTTAGLIVGGSCLGNCNSSTKSVQADTFWSTGTASAFVWRDTNSNIVFQTIENADLTPAYMSISGNEMSIAAGNSTFRFTDSSQNTLAFAGDLGTTGYLEANGVRVGSATGAVDSTGGTLILTVSGGSEFMRGTSTQATVPNGVLLALGTSGTSIGNEPARTRGSSGSASLDWGATAGATCDVLTITGTGNATIGDPCTVGAPVANTGTIWCRVSTTSTTAPVATIVRCCNNGESVGVATACSNTTADGTYTFRTTNP